MARIEKIELRMVDLKPKVRRTDAIQSFVSQETPIVTITDSDGATGTGYSYTIGTGGSSVMRLIADHLAPRIVGATLESFDDSEAVLSDGTRVPARTLVWAAGVRASPDLERLGLPLDDRGRVIVGPTLQVEGTDDVWALGDGAAVPNTRTPGRVDPPTCQHALRQARRLAKNLTRPPKPYGYRMLGQVATLGRYKGIAELPGLQLRGFLGWFVARTYHLYALPTFRRKVRVVTDWTVSLFFRRDIVELSALSRPHRLDP